ncbi:RING finger protein B [Forsythia ovata]|uniref:RING finger protein B n=1 Tax=Forsythia ovata TaxID=205694 RepID=A0ABD1PL93_9LAMI
MEKSVDVGIICSLAAVIKLEIPPIPALVKYFKSTNILPGNRNVPSFSAATSHPSNLCMTAANCPVREILGNEKISPEVTGGQHASANKKSADLWPLKVFKYAREQFSANVHILDADTLVWCKLNTTGQLLPPRGGHTTIAFGKNLFVFGGFSNEQNLYDDVYMLDLENGIWTKVIASGEGLLADFPWLVKVWICRWEVFLYLCAVAIRILKCWMTCIIYTWVSRENEQDERQREKLSLRKQLKLKCQVQNVRHNFYLNERQDFSGVLFSNKPIYKNIVEDNSNREIEATENDRTKQNDNHSTAEESTKHVEHYMNDVKQTDGIHHENRLPEVQMEAATEEKVNPGPEG